jgi:NADP-dependent 3-hydroxy acid dehydrogenase YdfG
MLGARRVDRIQSLADELTGSGGKALAVATDVTHRDPLQAAIVSALRARETPDEFQDVLEKLVRPQAAGASGRAEAYEA